MDANGDRLLLRIESPLENQDNPSGQVEILHTFFEFVKFLYTVDT